MSDGSFSTAPRIAIVGGGLAGLATTAALVTRGCSVEVFEARRKLGGRAGSYVDRATDESVDHCQHVAMGCCTNFLDFCRRTEIADLFTRHQTLHFFGPDGRRSDFTPSRWLPAPLHLIGPLLSLKYVSLTDKLAIARAMMRLVRSTANDAPDGPTVLEWLRAQQQSSTAIERFWKVVLVSALGESLDRASLAAARKVFADGFLAHPDASNLLVPRVSLGELYDRRVAGWLSEHGAAIHLASPVEMIGGDERAVELQLVGGNVRQFDFVIVAVPWQRLAKLLSPAMRAVIDPSDAFASIPSAPISSVHLWFDRPLTDLPHAVLVERLSQWVFARAQIPLPSGEGAERSEAGEGVVNAASESTLTPALSQREREPDSHYYQVVISASHDLVGRERQSVVDEVIRDLAAVFPRAAGAKLLRWQLITEQQAVFSVRPGVDAIRPAQQTAVSNLLLAGDWTRTGWPATMEGAVRSGYRAAEDVLMKLGRPDEILAPDLPRGWLVKRF